MKSEKTAIKKNKTSPFRLREKGTSQPIKAIFGLACYFNVRIGKPGLLTVAGQSSS